MTETANRGSPSGTGRFSRIGLVLGPLIFIALLFLPAPEGLSDAGWRVAGVAVLMAIWWASEALPLAVTALLPLILFPLLGLGAIGTVSASFAHPLIFLFLSGFTLALGFSKAGLKTRLALMIVTRVGRGPKRLVLGFMLATAALSMWISNTATVLLLLPMAVSVIDLFARDMTGISDQNRSNFATAMILGIAYAASIGGLGTLVGTPPNALLAGILSESFAIEIGFAQWMGFAMPLVLVLLPLAWLVLTAWLFPFTLPGLMEERATLSSRLKELGPVSRDEKCVALVFGLVAGLWVGHPLIPLAGLNDTTIGIAGAVVLFILPSAKGGRLLAWEDMAALPWGILILLGGGLALASGVSGAGLDRWLGEGLAAFDLGLWLLVALATALVLFLTELTSNTATAATFLPVLGGLAVTLGVNPALLMAPAALAASAAFMLPVATPPNAAAYATGHVSIAAMMRAGLVVNLIGLVCIFLLIRFFGPLLL